MQINNNTLPKLKLLKTINKRTNQTVFVVLITDIRTEFSSGAQPSIAGYEIPTLMVGTQVSLGAALTRAIRRREREQEGTIGLMSRISSQ